jgi:hypothetical protein
MGIYFDFDGLFVDSLATVNLITGAQYKQLTDYNFKDLENIDQRIIQESWEVWPNVAVPCERFLKILKESNLKDIKILTARDVKNNAITFQWLDLYFKTNEIISINHEVKKHLFLQENDILIDDRPQTIAECRAHNKNAFLYTTPTLQFKKEIAFYGVKPSWLLDISELSRFLTLYKN